MEELRMSVLSEAGKLFDARAKARGRHYFQGGLVTIKTVSRDQIVARVRGSSNYTVTIDLGRHGSIEACGCTCPVMDEWGDYCKHIWATLLQASAEGALPNDGPTLLATPQPVVPEWKQSLLKLRRYQGESAQWGPKPAAPAQTLTDRRIVYVIDIPDVLSGLGVTVEICTQKQKGSGGWDRPRRFSGDQRLLLSAPEEVDRILVQMLLGVESRNSFPGYAHNTSREENVRRFIIPPTAYETMLKRMCQTGRCGTKTEPKQESFEPLDWDDGEPWQFQLDLSRSPGEKFIHLGGALSRGEGERMALESPLALTKDGLVITRSRVARLQHFGAWQLLQHLRQHPQIKAPLSDLRELLGELIAHRDLPKLNFAAELPVQEVSVEPRFILRVRQPGDKKDYYPILEADLSIDYDGAIVSQQEPNGAVFDVARGRIIRRDRAREQAAFDRLLSLGVRLDWNYRTNRNTPTLAAASLNKLVVTLINQGWRVEAEGAIFRRPGEMKLAIEGSGIDWFELNGGVEYDGKLVGLPRLLAAMARGEKTVTLDDGSIGLLPEEWLAKYAPLAGFGQEHENGESLKFSRAQAGFLDALLAKMPEVSCDETFSRVRDELRAFERIEPCDPPDGFIGELRPYQREGLGWLHFLNRFGFGGCLADDMGLGKTVQVLALLEQRRAAKAGPSLVVVPKSIVFNWKAEAKRFAPQLRLLDHVGINRTRAADHFSQFDLIITTYGTLRRDAAYFKETIFDYVILDEAQAIKNSSTDSAKAARLLRGRHRLAMSGTPVENRVSELWSIFEFLNPGMLGAASVFRTLTGNGVETEGRQLLARALRPFILRRTKGQVAKDLPEKLEQTIYCDLDPSGRKLYDELRDHYRTSLLARVDKIGLNKSKIQVLEALLRLRQAACHPGLIDDSRAAEASAKLDALLDQIEDVTAEGHKALVFSQFTSLLALLRKRLDASKTVYEYLDGKTRDRQAKVERFQTDPNCPLFLISLKAGGVGLNLTAADYVFLLDPWWNPAVEAQAIDRTHRIGQTRRVFAYRLIARDTVEEKVLELQQTKRDLADAIINADNSVIAGLGREDLELLLS